MTEMSPDQESPFAGNLTFDFRELGEKYVYLIDRVQEQPNDP